MFRRVNVPVLGIVENMSYFLCPECGTRSDIFGHGGAKHEAERQGVAFLGEVPLHMTIREKSDAGLPVVATEPDGPHAVTYRRIASAVREQLAVAGRVPPGSLLRPERCSWSIEINGRVTLHLSPPELGFTRVQHYEWPKSDISDFGWGEVKTEFSRFH